MQISELLSRLEGVKGHSGQYMAKCPAHEDKRASLCVSRGDDGRILMKCQAGCPTEAVTAALGLSMTDLFPEKPQKYKKIVATYQYKDESGNLLGEKVRYDDKSFCWKREKNGNWEYKKPERPIIYNLPDVINNDTIFLVEGEKDADAIYAQGAIATCSPDGAGEGKWKNDYTKYFKGKTVFIIQDNDDVGKNFAQEEAAAISEVAKCVKVLDLCQIWDDLPEHGDTSDLMKYKGSKEAMTEISILADESEVWKPIPPEKDPFLACFKTLDMFEEEEATWIVPGWIPEGQITLIAADGGVGKTTLWCNLISAISNGTRCILDPVDYTRKPEKVGFLTTEDSVRKKIKRKLRVAGANQHNIVTPDFLTDKSGQLRGLKFGSEKMRKFVSSFRLVLCIFDPVQGFIPPDINMGSRNAMRDCMAPLISLGEEYGTTFIVVCHTNKRKGAYGRDRIADSADLWDIARSVIMAGFTEEQGIRYISNEKNNYTELQETILFSINKNGLIQHEGTSWKRDKEYMADAIIAKAVPKRDDCKEYILHELDKAGGYMKTKELEDLAKAAGYSFITIRRAKDELKTNKEIRYIQTGSPKEKVWHIEKTGFIDLPDDFPDPFNEPRQEHPNEQMKL